MPHTRCDCCERIDRAFGSVTGLLVARIENFSDRLQAREQDYDGLFRRASERLPREYDSLVVAEPHNFAAHALCFVRKYLSYKLECQDQGLERIEPSSRAHDVEARTLDPNGTPPGISPFRIRGTHRRAETDHNATLTAATPPQGTSPLRYDVTDRFWLPHGWSSVCPTRIRLQLRPTWRSSQALRLLTASRPPPAGMVSR